VLRGAPSAAPGFRRAGAGTARAVPVAIVTGSDSGIGEATAVALAGAACLRDEAS
jgi:hypothetical protein